MAPVHAHERDRAIAHCCRRRALHLILLASAANRADGALLPAPDSVTAEPDRVRKAIAALLRRKLAARNGEAVLITDAGRVAIGAIETDVPQNSSEPAESSASSTPRAGTKAALLVDLLSGDAGATLDAVATTTGWLPHTVRAAMTGLRKRGHSIVSDKADGVRRWRIVR